MPDIKICYFDARGAAELSRLVLAAAGEKFEDIRWSREDWPKYKPEAPYGQAPFMEYKGKKYGQSIAIANFLAREFGMYGKNNLEGLRIDEVMGLIQDVWKVRQKVIFEQDKAKKEEVIKKNRTEEFPRFFGFFNKLLAENKPNGFFVGKDVTLADLAVFEMMFSLANTKEYDVGEAFPDLKAFKEKVDAKPNIKAYLAQRKATEF